MSFIASLWDLCEGSHPYPERCDDEDEEGTRNTREIRITDLTLPGAFVVRYPGSLAHPDPVFGYGYFCLHANPLHITVYFFEPLIDGSGDMYHYVGQVTHHDESDPSDPETTIQGKRQRLRPDGTRDITADEEWTSNRPVA